MRRRSGGCSDLRCELAHIAADARTVARRSRTSRWTAGRPESSWSAVASAARSAVYAFSGSPPGCRSLLPGTCGYEQGQMIRSQGLKDRCRDGAADRREAIVNRLGGVTCRIGGLRRVG